MKPFSWDDRRLAMALGLWMPLMMVAVRLVRFDEWFVSWSELLGLALFYLVGCLAAAAFVSSIRRHPRRRLIVSLVYLLFMPVSVLFALAGGLFGTVGVLVGGTSVFVVPWGICRAMPARPHNAGQEPSPDAES